MTAPTPDVARFRAKLLLTMTFLAIAITGTGFYFADRKVAAETAHDLERDFDAELAALHAVQEVRHAALAERCRALARRPRIHAALEDNALDLLYPSAKDELRDLMEATEENAPGPMANVLGARFYRFLDADGAVIAPPKPEEIGELRPEEEAQIALKGTSDRWQLGYLSRSGEDSAHTVDEIIAMPIFSSDTGEPIAALVLGFKAVQTGVDRVGRGLRSGILVAGRLNISGLSADGRARALERVSREIAAGHTTQGGFTVEVDGTPNRVFYRQLNPDSLYAPAYEVCVYSLEELLRRQGQLFWQALGACAVLLAGSIALSPFLAIRLARPVEKLAIDSAEDRTKRRDAEAKLEVTSAELQRAARFSANASHQLKTPVTVLRAGLEELLAGEDLSPEMREEVSALVHQTFRLSSIVEELLLLSRMDAGRLQISFTAVDLGTLIAGLVDDLSAVPDAAQVALETDCPAFFVKGERRYISMILQNLLENARKYNRPDGRIRVATREEEGEIIVTVANTGAGIPPEAREHIFERFHRGAAGENVPGHGLGLNLARELARLHGGDLRLTRTDAEWTEFEVRFQGADAAAQLHSGAAARG